MENPIKMVALELLGVSLGKVTLPETNSEFTLKNGWLEDDPFLLGRPIFRGELLVSGRVVVDWLVGLHRG